MREVDWRRVKRIPIEKKTTILDPVLCLQDSQEQFFQRVTLRAPEHEDSLTKHLGWPYIFDSSAYCQPEVM